MMQSLTDTYTLNNGVKIPCVGFGTWQTPSGEVATDAVKAAIAAGYRHIDTASAYQNEASVGQGIRESGVPREELFITTKLHFKMHGYENTKKNFEDSMKNLGLEYLDLYLVHWPRPTNVRDTWQEALAGSWRLFEEMYAAGRIRAIGISNFYIHHMDALLEFAKVKPAVNQLHLCPGDTHDELVAYCRKLDILPEAYSPMGTGKAFEVPELIALAEKYDRSIAQVCIRWSLQMGFLPLPKSVTPSRIEENAKVFDFELEDADVRMLAGLEGACGYFTDPDHFPG